MQEIFNRRSIRKFTDKPVSKEIVDKLLRAAMQAPSAANQQPWEFIVVQDKDALQTLAETTPYSKPVANSAVTFVLLGNEHRMRIPTGWQQDMGACAQNILLEATHLGLGSVWLGIATAQPAADAVQKRFNLPEHIKPFCFIAVGYPDGQENQFVDRYDEQRVFYEAWENREK